MNFTGLCLAGFGVSVKGVFPDAVPLRTDNRQGVGLLLRGASSTGACGGAQTPGPALPADTGEWLHGNWQGQAVQLAYDAAERSWSRGAATPVSWTPPVADGGTTLYRCCSADGAGTS